MQVGSDQQTLKERQLAIAFNIGLQAALYVLEKVEELSADGRRFLTGELRKQIANGD